MFIKNTYGVFQNIYNKKLINDNSRTRLLEELRVKKIFQFQK